LRYDAAPVALPPVFVTARIPSRVLDRLREHADVDIHDGPDDLTRDELLRRVRGKQGLVVSLPHRIDAELLDAAPTLRVAANIAVGYDNIDLRTAASRGVIVTNTPDVLTDAVADFTIGLILDVTRRITEGDRLVRARRWSRWALDFMLGMDLRDKQLGVIGFGRIGRAVARRAQVLGMRIAYASASSGENGGQQARDRSMPDARRLSLDELLISSDVISVHVPLTSQTRGLIDQRALARMKRSAFLINTARGPVVDEAALAWALREHLIAGAALDVYEREPEVHPDLLGLDNVVLAPHLGSATRETRTAMADLAVRNVIAVLSGAPPITPVTG
jgi:glyoxylate reductase